MRAKILTLFAGLVTTLSAHPKDFRPSRFANDRTVLYPAKVPKLGRVVLVHGFLETGSNFRQLRERLQKCGFDCLVPRLRPCDGRGGLDQLALGLKSDIDEHFGTDSTIAVVGFSMGGIVSRHYLQHLGGADRCKGLITISSPHHGTHAAWIYPSKGVQQMRPGSRYLRELSQTESNLRDLPVASYRTPYDLVILPASNSHWQRAENLSYPVLLHPWMLNSSAVLDDVEQRLLGHFGM